MRYPQHFADMLTRHPEITLSPSRDMPGNGANIVSQPRAHPSRNATLFILRLSKREPRRYYHTQGVSDRYPKGWLRNRTRYVVTGRQYNVCEWDWSSDTISVRHTAESRGDALRELNRLLTTPDNTV